MWVFGLIAALPLIEIALFVTIGAWLGLWLTLAIVLGTAVFGVQVIRQQGLGAVQEFQNAGPGADPLSPLAHRAMKVVAGGLLILPGFFTDTLGVLLLIPPLRELILRFVVSRVQMRGFVVTPTRRADGEDWIDGEYVELPPDRDQLDGGSKWRGH